MALGVGRPRLLAYLDDVDGVAGAAVCGHALTLRGAGRAEKHRTGAGGGCRGAPQPRGAGRAALVSPSDLTTMPVFCAEEGGLPGGQRVAFLVGWCASPWTTGGALPGGQRVASACLLLMHGGFSEPALGRGD